MKCGWIKRSGGQFFDSAPIKRQPKKNVNFVEEKVRSLGFSFEMDKLVDLEEQIEIFEPNTKGDMVVGDNACNSAISLCGVIWVKAQIVKWLC